MFMLPLGTRVTMSLVAKDFYEDTPDNPFDEEGVISEHLPACGDEYIYAVDWDNGGYNLYRAEDLDPIPLPKTLLEDFL